MIYRASSITAYVGVSSSDDQNKASRRYPVSRVFVHPDYRTGPSGSGHADVAVLQLAKSIEYVDGIEDGCIDYSESIESYYIVAGSDSLLRLTLFFIITNVSLLQDMVQFQSRKLTNLVMSRLNLKTAAS